MFIDFSQRLPGGARIMFGTTLDKLMGVEKKTKREIDRDEFLIKVNDTKREVFTSMLNKANVRYEIFNYACVSNVEYDESEIFDKDNIITLKKISNLLNKVQELQEKAEFSNTLSTATKEKITNLLFEAKKELQNVQCEQNAESKILEKIAQSQNKTIEQIKKQLKSFSRSKNPLIALVLGIFLGWAGVDRFYKGDIKFGFIKMVTIGGFLFWWLIDLYIVPKRIKQGKYKHLGTKQIFLVAILLLFWAVIVGAIASDTQQTMENHSTTNTNIK